VTFKYFRNPRDLFFKIGEYHSAVPQLVYIQSRDLFRPISCEQKYLMNYDYIYLITKRYLSCTLIFKSNPPQNNNYNDRARVMCIIYFIYNVLFVIILDAFPYHLHLSACHCI